MVRTLHILNGESTLNSFKQSKIDGHVFVWHEVLCEGPTRFDISSDEFWSVRSEFVTESFETTKEEFQNKVIFPFKKLEEEITQYTEIILWFEYDLFCQINMIALLSWLKDLQLQGQISLICVGETEGSDILKGLGELPPTIYPYLLQKRVKLNTRELTHAQDAWEAYCSEYPDDLYNFVLLKMEEFQYLPAALECHLKRFPFLDSGLNEIEKKAIELYQSSRGEKTKTVGQLLKWDAHYGFGDLQYFKVLKYLEPLLILLGDDNNEILKTKVEELLDRDYELGGATVSKWCWDSNERALIPKEPMP